MQVQRLAVFGITGRMGRSILRVLRDETSWRLSGALASPRSASLHQDAAAGEGPASGVQVTADPRTALGGIQGPMADAAVDFSAAEAVGAHAQACAEAGVPLLVGTTALPADGRAAIERAAESIPVLVAPNTSVGVGVLAELVRFAARALDGYDVEIHEAHHRMKRDAPSGTALKLGEIVAQARSGPERPANLADLAVYDRHGAEGPRSAGSIGFSVVRAGDIVGEHTVIFAGDGERLEITHRATDRDVFARGALRGAAWLVRRAPGLYSLQDVLRL